MCKPLRSAATDLDLVFYLKVILEAGISREVRNPALYMLLAGLLVVLSDCRNSRDLQAFAKMQREAMNHALDQGSSKVKHSSTSVCACHPISVSKPGMAMTSDAKPQVSDQKSNTC